jgi:hypothetical protein
MVQADADDSRSELPSAQAAVQSSVEISLMLSQAEQVRLEAQAQRAGA